LAFDVRRSVRRFVRKSGFRRQIAPTFVDVMLSHQVDVVLDVGANDGDFGREIRDEGYRGRIVSFEPNPAAFARLAAAIADDPLWEAHQLGVGAEEGSLRLSVAKADVFSSFKPTTELWANSPHSQEAESVEVAVIRLDRFLRERPDLLRRAYLKIDTQGFEMEVLRGAGDALLQMEAVQAELALIKTYQNEEDWLDVVTWMRGRGFEVATAICNSAFPRRQIREFDFVFVQRPRDEPSAASAPRE
jgi:FkbM family methyltransferase